LQQHQPQQVLNILTDDEGSRDTQKPNKSRGDRSGDDEELVEVQSKPRGTSQARGAERTQRQHLQVNQHSSRKTEDAVIDLTDGAGTGGAVSPTAAAAGGGKKRHSPDQLEGKRRKKRELLSSDGDEDGKEANLAGGDKSKQGDAAGGLAARRRSRDALRVVPVLAGLGRYDKAGRRGLDGGRSGGSNAGDIALSGLVSVDMLAGLGRKRLGAVAGGAGGSTVGEVSVSGVVGGAGGIAGVDVAAAAAGAAGTGVVEGGQAGGSEAAAAAGGSAAAAATAAAKQAVAGGSSSAVAAAAAAGAVAGASAAAAALGLGGSGEGLAGQDKGKRPMTDAELQQHLTKQWEKEQQLKRGRAAWERAREEEEDKGRKKLRSEEEQILLDIEAKLVKRGADRETAMALLLQALADGKEAKVKWGRVGGEVVDLWAAASLQINREPGAPRWGA
jgi:hypothetical protein